MSAPLAVNTADGTCWTRRAVTRGGLALYAPEGVCNCPPFVMATLPELAEHGIQGSADALPMPAGPEPKAGPRSFDLVGEVVADDYDDAVYAAEQAYSGMRGQGYKGSISVDTGSGQSAAEADALELPGTALEHVQAILLAHFGELPRPDMAVGLLLTNLRAEWQAEDRARTAELEAQREALAARLRAGQRWQEGRTPPLVSQDTVSQDELRAIFGIELTAPWETSGTKVTSQPAAGASYPPALPWAKHVDADDLEGFLADLADAASGDDDLTTLAAVESAIATWRLIAEAQHAHNTAPGPDAEDGGK
ncbi:hypothetical protein [Streptomyces coelicoflavus]|uniref:hypothetical protein n=1 Tax=Streptomyces coelicoflavus TaxID=285562 RepID=UPI0036340A0D